MPGADECGNEMFVTIRWDRKDGLAVRVIAHRIEKFPDLHEIPSVEEMRGILRN